MQQISVLISHHALPSFHLHLAAGSPALQYAKPYLFIRAFAFLPSLVSLIGFSAFRGAFRFERLGAIFFTIHILPHNTFPCSITNYSIPKGTLDTSTPLKISATSNIFNAILDPILMFTMAMGVPGAALATLGSEIISASSFFVLMLRCKMIRWSKLLRLPSWSKLKPLLEGGAALQLRNVSLNLTFLAVARVTQSLDDTGVAAAAHGKTLFCPYHTSSEIVALLFTFMYVLL